MILYPLGLKQAVSTHLVQRTCPCKQIRLLSHYTSTKLLRLFVDFREITLSVFSPQFYATTVFNKISKSSEWQFCAKYISLVEIARYKIIWYCTVCCNLSKKIVFFEYTSRCAIEISYFSSAKAKKFIMLCGERKKSRFFTFSTSCYISL